MILLVLSLRLTDYIYADSENIYNPVNMSDRLLREIDSPVHPYLFVHMDLNGNKYGVLIEPFYYKNDAGELVATDWKSLFKNMRKIPNGYVRSSAKRYHSRATDYIPDLYNEFEYMLNEYIDNHLLSIEAMDELKNILSMSRIERSDKHTSYVLGAVASYTAGTILIISLVGSPIAPPFMILGSKLSVQAKKYDETLRFEKVLTEYERHMRLAYDTKRKMEAQRDLIFKDIDTKYIENKLNITKLEIQKTIPAQALKIKTKKVETHKYRALRYRALRGGSYCRMALSGGM